MSRKTQTTATKGEAKTALLPKLRFPEFRGAGEWEETRLGRMGVLVSGLTYSPDDVRESGLLVLRSSNVQNGEIALDDCVYVDPSIKGANLSQPNDILICVRNGSKALIGKCALIPEGMPLCTHGAFMTVFRAQTPSFVFQLFQSDRYQKQVDGDLGATINSINGSQLLKYEFSVPKPAEQQKIASCLSSVDELMDAQARKVDALKTHKKGLMQQLFPREGETQPRLRFPEFQNAGEWREDALGNVCAVLNNRRRPITSSDRKPGPYRYYGASGVVDHVDNYIFDERVVLVGEDGAKWGAFERTAFIVEGKFWVNNHAHVLKPHGVNDALLENYLTMADLGAFVTGAAPPKLTLGKLKEIPVPIPPDEKEGEAIATCLSSLDALITAETQKLEALKTHKKGLMQQLFPSPEEVEA